MPPRKDQNSQRKLPPRNYFRLQVKEAQSSAAPPSNERLHHRMLHGSMDLEIRVLSPVFVGSGAYGLSDSGLAKEPVLRNGSPVIPGTSIKGICRVAHEAITQSASPWTESSEKPTLSGALFGYLGFQGRVSFDDAISEDPIQLRLIRATTAYPPGGPEGRRFYGVQPPSSPTVDTLQNDKRSTIPCLAIPSGTKLKTVLRVRNLLDDENDSQLGSILLALGLEEFTPKLGGVKYDKWGWVRFKPIAWRPRRPFRTSKEVSEDDLQELVRQSRRKAESLLSPTGRSNLRELRRRMQAPIGETEGRS